MASNDYSSPRGGNVTELAEERARRHQYSGSEPPGGGTPPRDPALKFRAKRINEHVKSVYSVANTLGAAIIGAAFIIPAVTKGPNGPDLDAPGWCLIGLVLILGGHAAIWRFMRSEE